MSASVGRLTQSQLRQVADDLYCGVYETASLMQQIRMFKRGDEILLWLVRNNIRGRHLVDFFKNASNSESNQGVLRGCEVALKYIDGHKSVKAEKLYLDSLHSEL